MGIGVPHAVLVVFGEIEMRSLFINILILLSCSVVHAGEVTNVVPINIANGHIFIESTSGVYREWFVEVPAFDTYAGTRELTNVSVKLCAEFSVLATRVNNSGIAKDGDFVISNGLFAKGPLASEEDALELEENIVNDSSGAFRSTIANYLVRCEELGDCMSLNQALPWLETRPTLYCVSFIEKAVSAAPQASVSVTVIDGQIDLETHDPSWFSVENPTFWWSTLTQIEYPFSPGSTLSIVTTTGTIEVTYNFETDANDGDVNCDGVIDINDVPGFVDSILESAAACDSSKADVNNDGTINSSDIEPFLGLILGS